MLSGLFYWVLNASFIGCIAGLIVLALRQIKCLPRSVVFALWALPFIRLWLPFGIANDFSLLSLLSRYTTKTVVLREGHPELTATNMIMGAESYKPMVYKTNLLEDLFQVSSFIWIIVSCAAILSAILLYYFTKTELKSAERIKDNIYKSDRISSPAVYGIIRPRIIIPNVIADKDLPYIIQHEDAHIARKDNLFRLIAVITACIHWFNPFAWLFLKYFFIDMELACDAKVLKSLNKSQQKEYAYAILSKSSGKALFASAFGGAKTRVRIESILSYKKLTILSALFITAFIAVIAFVILTNAAA